LLGLAWVLSGCSRCEPGHITECECGDGEAGKSICSDDGLGWGDCACPVCETAETQACVCEGGTDGFQVCSNDRLSWEPCECSTCNEYVNTVCGCEGVDDFYEAIGTTCWETYQPLIDQGDPEACELAMDAFEAAGGCDQFGILGDDDDTN